MDSIDLLENNLSAHGQAYRMLVSNGTDTSSLEGEPICKPSDFKKEHPVLESVEQLYRDMVELGKYRSAPKRVVVDKQLKIELLSRLSCYLPTDVGDVLDSIVKDLEAYGSPH